MKESLQKRLFFCLELFFVLLLILTFPSVRAQVSLEKVGEEVEYTSQDLRAPFKSPFDEAPVDEAPVGEPTVKRTLSHLRVQGMVWASSIPQAIINNTVLSIGEVIEGAEILDIRKEGIYMLYEGREYILKPPISQN